MELFHEACEGSYDMTAAKWYEFEPSLVDTENVEEMIGYYKEVGIMQ